MTRFPARAAAAAVLGVAMILSATACSGTTGGEQGPVQVSSAMPAAGPAPGLGAATAGGVTLSGVGLQRSGSGIAVVASITSTHPDRLLSIGSNYTQTTVLPQPVPVSTAAPTTIEPRAAVLRPSGPIDDGATVSVTFTFATAGAVQAFGTYRS